MDNKDIVNKCLYQTKNNINLFNKYLKDIFYT